FLESQHVRQRLPPSRLIDIGRGILRRGAIEDEELVKPPHRNECARRGSRLQLTAVKELQKLRDVGSLNVENIDPAQMLAIHREIVLIRLNRVFGDSLLNAKVLKE